MARRFLGQPCGQASGTFNKITAALRKYFAEKGWQAEGTKFYLWVPTSLTPDELLAEDQKLAGHCLGVMESFELGGGTSGSDVPGHKSAFPDGLIAALGLFILPEDYSRYPRLTRLQGRKHQPVVGPTNLSNSAVAPPPTGVAAPPPALQVSAG
ncbi:uncharacterized protein PHACADRAFT_262741 [Phanerochaete carnosa HHB-10118-sp]|uniref:Uncharacterized protein n=1 Tax=Phanerochaete carnosa (strain HHB-10118-sp) TaxID=650164 RepID=K5UMF3_PHACS|nr:uncharacterized protein PHACADRAFT_262741 [Phanerochaete carnosa HHB-10118-sp]EKM50861.1 hypothetical protein PHACADRAFT_262741 [Phanerochaete carnosa HHB-10118-sp]